MAPWKGIFSASCSAFFLNFYETFSFAALIFFGFSTLRVAAKVVVFSGVGMKQFSSVLISSSMFLHWMIDGAGLVGPLPLPLLGAPEGLLGVAVGRQGGVDEGAEVALMIEIKVDNVTTAVNVKYQWNIMSDLLKGRKKKP